MIMELGVVFYETRGLEM